MTSKIDRLFGSKTRVTLLTKLLTNPQSTFYTRELSRDLHIPYSMLYKEEKNLLTLSIIKEEKKGKITLISANTQLPYFNELKMLLNKTAGLGDLLKQSFSKLQSIRYALVYGSVARGEDTASSDIDILIVGKTPEEEILSITSELEKQVGREINYILWDTAEFMQRVKSKHPLILDIAAKPMIMLVGSEDEFRGTVKEPSNMANTAKQRSRPKSA
jgi:predicted nucleotidyltransferase